MSERNNKHGELSKEYIEAHLAKNKIFLCLTSAFTLVHYGRHVSQKKQIE